MKKIWDKNIKLMLMLIIDIVIISASTYAATTYLFNSVDVGYDNSSSGLVATNVQGALDELYVQSNNYSAYESRLSSLESKIGDIQEIYPVGSIYIGINNTNPSTYFGGTWVSFGTGQTLVGIDSNDSSFDTIEETGGAKSISYTPSGSVGNHTLTVSEIPAHTHGSKTLSGYINFKRFGVSGTGYDLAMGTSGIISKTPTSANATLINCGATSKSTVYYDAVTINATHEHSSVGGSGAHNHPFSGTESSINVVQPYITVYMWKRTA